MNIRSYRSKFERRVILPGVKLGLLGRVQEVSPKPCRLSSKPFGLLMGKEVDTDEVLVIDYYGLKKRSRGFNRIVSTLEGTQIKFITAKVIFFQSIRLEVIATLAPGLVRHFPWFKTEILHKRGLKRRDK